MAFFISDPSSALGPDIRS